MEKRSIQYVVGALVFLAAVMFFVWRASVEQPSERAAVVVEGENSSRVAPSTTATGDVAPALPNVLDVSNAGISVMPMVTFERTDLVTLNLSHNKLSGALPAEVRHLQNLEVLDLSNNTFTGVPAEVGQLKKLRYLNLAHNKLTGLPHELGNLQNLETLILTGNDYSSFDLDSIRKGLPASTSIIVD